MHVNCAGAPLNQWRTEGAEGEIRPGRHSGRGGKKGGKEKKKKRKKGKKEGKGKRKKERKRKYGRSICNNSETKMEYLSFGAPMHVKPNILAPQAIQARTRG